MRHKCNHKNIPIEVMRTLVAVVETGSFTSAGQRLGLTQPGISLQMKRLREMLCVDVFEKGPGPRLTKAGTVILSYARRIVSMNDQLLEISGRRSAGYAYRIGIPSWMGHRRLVETIKACTSVHEGKVSFRCDALENLMRDLGSGHLDLALFCSVTEPAGIPVAEWSDPLYWMMSQDFQINPGDPIPLVSWPGSMSDRVALSAFEEHGIKYNISFSSPDFGSRIAAVAAGQGVLIANERVLTPEIRISRDQSLPTLPPVRMGIYMREHLEGNVNDPVVRAFVSMMQPRTHDALIESQKVVRFKRD